MSTHHNDHTRGPLFRLGQLVATPGAIEVMERLGIHPLDLIARHVTGDWGDLDAHDCAVNEEAVISGARIFSAYGPRVTAACGSSRTERWGRSTTPPTRTRSPAWPGNGS